MSAVTCKNVTLYRGDDPVLGGINLHVHRGQIYGLLGPSGCGKTTLLKCILGDLRPDEGKVTVLGQRPGRTANLNVGYMPQEDALCELFSVRETLVYFGRLYGMTIPDIRVRMDFVTNLLCLKLHDRVAHLSGGQRRRLSLAVCILHAPPLLILDEPTVGVDPLLAHVIWKHLRRLTEEAATTIIVTTHYIEEAHSADVVGLMRNGRILVEHRPQVLMASYEVQSLEAVLLEVCRHPDEVNTKLTPIDYREVEIVGGSAANSLIPRRCWLIQSFRRLATLLFKERCSFARHPGTILYKCVFPLITLSLFFYTMECDLPDLSVAIVDEDQTPQSWMVGEVLNSQDFIDVAYMNRSEAATRLDKLTIHAILILPQNYSTSKNASIEIDDVNPYFRSTVERAIRETFRNPLLSPDIGTILSAIPTTHIFGDQDDTPYKSVYHRVVAQLSFGPSMLASVTHVFVSAHDAFIHRSKVAGASTAELVLSFFISQGLLVLLQTFLLVLYLCYKVGNIITVEAWSLVYLLLAGAGFSGVSLSLVVCSECSEFISALYLALLLNVVTFVMCGEIWPREGMAPLLRNYIAPLWPISYPADAMGVILFKQRLFEDRLVQLGFVSAAAWVIGPLLLLTVISMVRKNSVF